MPLGSWVLQATALAAVFIVCMVGGRAYVSCRKKARPRDMQADGPRNRLAVFLRWWWQRESPLLCAGCGSSRGGEGNVSTQNAWFHFVFPAICVCSVCVCFFLLFVAVAVFRLIHAVIKQHYLKF